MIINYAETRALIETQAAEIKELKKEIKSLEEDLNKAGHVLLDTIKLIEVSQ